MFTSNMMGLLMLQVYVLRLLMLSGCILNPEDWNLSQHRFLDEHMRNLGVEKHLSKANHARILGGSRIHKRLISCSFGDFRILQLARLKGFF